MLARGTWDGTALTDVRDIFRSGATRTESSRIGFGRDGMLYMTISASGTGPDVLRSADPNDYAGKTVRLRDDGTIPPDNPFVGKAGYKPGIYTLGHRNGHSMALNPETGEFWVTEMGPNGGDEINVLKPGANYGWPYVSHGRNYMGPRISPTPGKDGTEQPCGGVGAVDCGGRRHLLHGRPVPGMAAQLLRRRLARRRDSAHRPDAAHRVQRALGGDSARAAAARAEAAHPRRAPGARRAVVRR